MKLRVGTRGSKLALAQTDCVITALQKIYPKVKFEKVIIKTTGDKILDSPLSKIGGKGLFVKEIEQALLRGDIDFAVHSMKDVPSELPEGLEIACIPERESPFDVWVSKYRSLEELPQGARVGTSSLRRLSQIKKKRKDLEILPLRGNVDTRLRKWKEGQFDGIILAEAGLKRLGIKLNYFRLSLEDMIPAVGQGALGIEVREDNQLVKKLLKSIHSKTTEICIKAERAFLKTLRGGCQVPLGAYAFINDKKLIITGFISDLNAERFYKLTEEGDLKNPEYLGETLAKKLLKTGGEEILKELYRE
ncbi:hydroxymethylbilane synthase [Candidatus Pacearchaeota archaeon]|nr:MAG: hydroxymethylbilane synthase [Candidatus Pacearchaeota archaeon]